MCAPPEFISPGEGLVAIPHAQEEIPAGIVVVIQALTDRIRILEGLLIGQVDAVEGQ